MRSAGTGGVVESALMPHAPVLIPEVGGGRERGAAATVEACRRIAGELVAQHPDVALVISPHAPRRADAVGLVDDRVILGDMSRFRSPEITIELLNDLEFVRSVESELAAADLRSWPIKRTPLDHGSFVPLYFLTRSGWSGPTVVMSLGPTDFDSLASVGRAVRTTASRLGKRVAIIASGDMSHSLQRGAPCGFHPRAVEFDQTFVEHVEAGRFLEISRINAELRVLANEDVVDSTWIAAQAANLSSRNVEVFSYEGPFGVGYCVARLFSDVVPKLNNGNLLPTIARRAVESKLKSDSQLPQVATNGFLAEPAGVFVTIRDRSGELRGCRGTIEPQYGDLISETEAVARSSAFQDSRFAPVDAGELDQLHYEVSVLHPAEPVASRAELDPHRYGVIVRTGDGRRGLMLPGVEGLDTVDAQINATCRKAHIDPREPMTFERFRVDKFTED